MKKKIKQIKAWAISMGGDLMNGDYDLIEIARTRKTLYSERKLYKYLAEGKVIPVLITPLSITSKAK